jgi:hypothetical protein
MELSDLVGKVADPYERKARLYPALLAMFPLVIMVMMLYGPKMSALMNVIMIAASCGGLYLMTNLCREFGKRLEPGLFQKWGGKPTTQLLRHRDNTIEVVTKRRYHSFLAGKINEPFPDKTQEVSDPTAADDVYQSAIRWLLNHIRDTTQFRLLFRENVTYGFRRNALGMKPIGLVISLGSLLWIFVTHGVVSMSANHFFNRSALIALPETAVASLIVSAFMFVVWVVFFTKATVRTAAFTYTTFSLSDPSNVK